MNNLGDKGIPPYIGWAAWNRLMQSMRKFVPPRLDRSYFNSLGFSGTQYSQAIRAFLYLSLVDDTRRPMEKLRQLVMRTDEERKEVLKSLITDAYKPFFDNPGPRDATLGDLESFLRSQGAKGVVDKCVTFFLAAAKEAGIPLSPQLAGEFGRKTGRRVKSRGKAATKQLELSVKTPALPGQNSGYFAAGAIDPQLVSYVAELPEEKQDKWLKAYIRVRKALRQDEMRPD